MAACIVAHCHCWSLLLLRVWKAWGVEQWLACCKEPVQESRDRVPEAQNGKLVSYGDIEKEEILLLCEVLGWVRRGQAQALPQQHGVNMSSVTFSSC